MVRVVFAEDNYLVREGTAALLQTSDQIDLVGTATTYEELLLAVDELRPEAVLTDIRMPPTNTTEGIDAARKIRGEHPEIGVVVLSQFADEEYAYDLLKDGAEGLGYLLKERVADVREFVDAVRRVATGGTVLDPEVVAAIMARSREEPVDRLTPREREVLALMAEGRSNAAIAAALFVTEKAVAKHTNSIFTKLDLPPAADDNRRVLAVLAWLKVVPS